MTTRLGFDLTLTMKDRLLSFQALQAAVYSQARAISQLTDIETAVYTAQHHSTYYAEESMITVFTDSTERSPTFRLFPLDVYGTPKASRKSWIQVWTNATNKSNAWLQFLQRPFRGMSPTLYEDPFSNEIDDVYLRKAALDSLKNASNEEQYLYDFSFSSENIQNSAPVEGDLGVVNLLADEIGSLTEENSILQQFLTLCAKNKALVAIIIVSPVAVFESARLTFEPTLQRLCPHALVIHLSVEQSNCDPLQVRQHIALKMALNAHSTGVMAKMGRVVTNTMTNVNPGNLKLIGRATFLILSHILANLPPQPEAIFSYEEANAVLFSAIEYCKLSGKMGENSEVSLCIIRVLETFRRSAEVTWAETEQLLESQGLERYLLGYQK